MFLCISDTMVCTGCCATLDNIITYLFKKLTKKCKKPIPPQDSEAFLRILEINPEILQQVSSVYLSRESLKGYKEILQIVLSQTLDFLIDIYMNQWLAAAK